MAEFAALVYEYQVGCVGLTLFNVLPDALNVLCPRYPPLSKRQLTDRACWARCLRLAQYYAYAMAHI